MTTKRFHYPIFGIIIFVGLFGWILPSKAARTWTEFFQQLGGSNHSTTNSSTTRGGIRKRPVQAPSQVPTLAEETQHFGNELKMAVVVGINAYPRFSGLRSLFYAKADAEALDKALKRAGYGVQLLTDKDATGGAILTAIDNIKQTLNPNEGTVIFAFAGHGFRDRSTGKNYLAPYEASVQRVRRTGLAVDEVETALVNTGARRRILFIDACRNDPLEGDPLEGKRAVPGVAATFTQHSLFQGAEGTRILFSTKAGGYSNEYPDLGHGIFTHFLLKGLAGQAANSQGFITFRSLANYVQTKVPLKAIERGDAQRPYDAGEGSGWFLVANAPQQPRSVKLTITTRPKAAQVRFVNQPWHYQPGMSLPVGNYPIQVSARGYHALAQTLDLQQNLTTRLALQPQAIPAVVQQGHTSYVMSVAFSPDGNYLASASYDNSIKLWRVSDGQLLNTLTGHIDYVNSVAFSPDGNYLASGSRDNRIKLWRVADGQLLKTLTGHTDSVYSVTFSPDGNYLASGSGDNNIKLWRVADGQLLKTLTDHTRTVSTVAFSPDSNYLASSSFDEGIKLWRVSDGQLLKTLAYYTGDVNSVAFSPDGNYLASGSYGSIKLWRVADDQLLNTLTGHTNDVSSVAFSPDGNYLASGGDNSIKLWRVADGQLLNTLTGHTNDVNSVAFSPDGNYLASGGDDNSIKLWRVADGQLLNTSTGHPINVQSVAFSPDGNYLASGGDNSIKLWRVSDGQLLKTLTGHTSWVRSVAFSLDGNYLASASDDKSIKLWRVADGQLLTLTGHTDDVKSVAFSPDGNYLASASDDKSIKLWQVADGKLVASSYSFSATDLKDYLTITPEGYFTGEQERINYVQGLETYPELREHYYRPEGIPLQAATTNP